MREFEAGHGISWFDSNTSAKTYGIVMSNDGTEMSVVRVRALRPYMKCYNDLGADRVRDKDRVALRDCPPPFVDVVNDTRSFCMDDRLGYVIAVVDEKGEGRLRFNEEDVRRFGISVIDDGEKVSESLMTEIREHPFPSQLELEKRRKKSNARGAEADAVFGLAGTDSMGLEFGSR